MDQHKGQSRKPRPAMPSATKRALRKEAGYGCSFCGYPFIQYHHIVPWAEEEHFRTSDMMPLCSRHHELCTFGAIGLEEQRYHKANPVNIANDMANGMLYVNETSLKVHLAGGMAIDTPVLLRIHGSDILTARLDPESSQLLLSADIHGKDGSTIARLVDNEWQVAPTGVWDFDCAPQRAVVRSESRNLAFAVDCRDGNVRVRGRWFADRRPIVFSEEKAVYDGSIIRGNVVMHCGVYLSIGDASLPFG